MSEENLCRILSWYAQGKMRVALTETREQQRKVYDLGCPAYAESLLVGFNRHGFNSKRDDMLPIDLPSPPPGFRSRIDFAVNLLQFQEKYKYLRSTLFWSVFSRTIVVKDLEHAQKYREHVVKLKQPCPAILTMNGDLIASDGLMDPGRRCPPSMRQLKYTFGELPPTEKHEYQNSKTELDRLEELKNAKYDNDVLAQHVEHAKKVLQNQERLNNPKIEQLEKKLKTLRAEAEKVEGLHKGPSPTKKRKK